MVAKDKLVFDISDALTIQASDSLGAYTRSGASGALITSHSSIETGTISFTFVDADVTPASDSIAETGHGLQTGDKVQLSNSGGALPAGLATLTNYYVIRTSANAFKLAASPSDAEYGISVDITAAAGGGTHTLTEQDSDKRSLDVNVTNPISATVSGTVAVTQSTSPWVVSSTDLDIRDLAFATDSVTAYQGTSPWVVSATNLDIRDLVFATDKVDVSGSSVSITGTVAVTQSTSPWVVSATNLDIRDLAFATDSVTAYQGTSPWVVSATDLDIRDLSAAQDSIDSWLNDGSGNPITSSGGALDVNIQSSDIEINVEDDKANIALENTATSVTTTAALLASQLSGRKFMWVQNHGNKAIYVGKSGVTNANGLRLSPGSVLEIRLGPAVSMHAVSQDGSAQDTRVMEAS